MTHRSTNAARVAPTTAARFALQAIALAAASLCASQALALGLGRLNVQSALGETLKAEIEVTSLSAEEASSLQLRVASSDAYRAAGVEYNSVLPSAQVQVVRMPDGRTVLRISSTRAVLEPFVDVIIEAAWSSGRLVREYTMLFDPPGSRTAQAAAPAAAPAAGPVVSPSAAANPPPYNPPPAATPPLAAAPLPAPRPAPRQQPPEPPRPPMASSAPPAAVPAPGGGADEYRVRPGDSLSRIAGRTQRPGVSLDQMLVSLFRGNPQAFSGDNMNRLKSGAVLSVPSADQAAKLAPQEARDTIVAQSNDFAAYRQRLAGGVTTAADEAPARQARGQVQAQVDDRKQAAAATPDRLTLSQGGAKASAAAAQASKATEKKDSTARLAELARNVDELKRLQSTGTPGAAAPTAPVVVAAAPKPAAAPAPAPAPALEAAPAPAPVVAAPAAPTAAIAPTVVAAAPPAPAPSPAPKVAEPAPAPAPPAATRPPAPGASRDEPGLMDSLLGNSLLLPAAGVLLALLVGLGVYRLRSRMRRPAGETSFLESRLQPDSFFGASGGQRIDTRDAAVSNSGNSSSMSYSLSQLDAIGDVDPVAEADVYLAYGRDLQAEEILKEAMRATPERMAIRGKLLEVYAKRRDTKAYELLASQMFNLTHGEGEDWAKAQALGLTIDPDNLLYQPGGQPGEVRGAGGQLVGDALGASTVPYTAPVNPPTFQPAPDATLDASGLDLDLELDMPDDQPAAAPRPPSTSLTETTMPITTHAQMRGDDTLQPDGGNGKTMPVKRTAPQPAADDGMLDFDLESLGAEQPTIAVPKPKPDPTLDFGDFSIGGEKLTATEPPTGEDALARKLELAEEFRQIGDLEGARDLLEEVLGHSEGPLKAKAQGMLDQLDR